MKKIFLIAVALVIAFVLPSLASADIGSQLSGYDYNGFKLQDLSFKYLQDIFGVVDGVLHGTGSQIMGRLFGVLNSAVLALGFMILAYTLLVSTLNTAHQGEILGKEWSSIWIPLRTVASVGLLVPKATGYSAIQIFMMWVVLQGVLAADMVMMAGLGYIKQGGVLIQSSPAPDSKMIKVAGNVFKSEICMYGYNNALNLQYGSEITVPNFVPTTVNVMTTTPTQAAIVYFPAKETPSLSNFPTVSLGGVCGSVNWMPLIPPDNLGATPTDTASGDSGSSYDIRGVAIQQVILDLLPLAQSTANILIPPQTGVSYGDLTSLINSNANQLIFAAADYKGIMMPTIRYNNKVKEDKASKAVQKIAEGGWVRLGSLYYALASANTNYGADDDNKPTADFTVSTSSSAWQLITPTYQSILYCTKDCADNVLTAYSAQDSSGTQESIDSGTTNSIDAFIVSSWQNSDADGLYRDSNNAYKSTKKKGVFNKIMSVLLGPLYTIPNSMNALMTAEKKNTDPIIAVTQLGGGILSLVTQLWVGIAGSLFILTSLSALMSCVNSVGFAIISTLIWLLPMFSAILLGLFVAGAMMAFYIPMIPFILFTFGVIGWFAAVIETMIAAPLVALGIAVPEGHNVFGKSTTAIMLLVNVFMRPTLMVFGFFAGAILSHVGLWVLNSGFGITWAMIFSNNWASLTSGGLVMGTITGGAMGLLWTGLAILIIYTILVVTIINQTFGLIYQLPEQIMRWIGGQHMGTMGASPGEALSGAKGGLESGMGKVGSAAEGVGKAGAKKTGDKIEKKNAKGDFEDDGVAK